MKKLVLANLYKLMIGSSFLSTPLLFMVYSASPAMADNNKDTLNIYSNSKLVPNNACSSFNLKLTFTCIEFKNNQTDNDLSKNNLNGNVKSVTSLSYEAKNYDGKLVKGDNVSEGLFEGNTVEIYNNTGYLLEEKNFYYDGSVYLSVLYSYDEKGKLVNRSNFNHGKKGYSKEFEYDENGNMINEYDLTPTGIAQRNWAYKYDKKGNNIERSYTYFLDESNDFKTLYEYDNDGNKVQESTYDKYGIQNTIIFYKHDTNGNLIEEKVYSKSDLFYTNEFKYDSKGNILEDIQTTSENEKIKISNKYDSNGNLISKIRISSQNKEYDFNYSYQYDYDNLGNWIKRVKFTNGKPQFIRERTIEYYK